MLATLLDPENAPLESNSLSLAIIQPKLYPIESEIKASYSKLRPKIGCYGNVSQY